MGKENDGGNLLSSASTAGARAPAATPGVGRMHSRVRIGDLPQAELADEVRMLRTQNRALVAELKAVNRLAGQQKVACQQAAAAQCRQIRADLQAEHVAEHTELLQLRVQATADHRELLQLRAQVSALRADLRVFSDAEEHLKAQDVDLYSPGVFARLADAVARGCLDRTMDLHQLVSLARNAPLVRAIKMIKHPLYCCA